MKKLTLILLSIIFLGTYKCSETLEVPNAKVGPVSFECVDLIETRTDKMTDYFTSRSKNRLVISDDGGKTGFEIFCIRVGTITDYDILIRIKVVGAGKCIDQGDVVNILFRDGSRLTFNSEVSRRDAICFIAFGGMYQKNKELNELTTKEIEAMRVWTSKGYVQKDFSSEQSKILMSTLKCLLQLKRDN